MPLMLWILPLFWQALACVWAPKAGACDSTPYPNAGRGPLFSWLQEDSPGECGLVERGNEALLGGSGGFMSSLGARPGLCLRSPPWSLLQGAAAMSTCQVPLASSLSLLSLIHLPGDLLGLGQTGLSPKGQPSADCGCHRLGGCLLCFPNDLRASLCIQSEEVRVSLGRAAKLDLTPLASLWCPVLAPWVTCPRMRALLQGVQRYPM